MTGVIVGLTLALGVAFAAGGAGKVSAQGAPERHPVEVPDRTPLYCEDSTHAIQPVVHGDFGDFVEAVGGPHLVATNGQRASSETTYVLVFNDKASGEIMGYVMTRHENGYALRSAYHQQADGKMQRAEGTPMCAAVTDYLLKLHPGRALQRHDSQK